MAFNHSIVGKTFGPGELSYDWQKTALYALGCGAGTDELELVLETMGPKVLPTFSVVLAIGPLHEAIVGIGGNMLTLVHGAQRCTVHRPIPPEAKVRTTCTVRSLFDKGKGALAIFDTKTVDEKNEPICDTEWQIFYRGEGGFGGERGPEPPAYNPPAGKSADLHVEMPTLSTQALLYRLGSHDLNPIHSSPDIAKLAGFPKPILHGLCTFGHAARAAINSLCGKDSDRLTSIEGRFSKPVFPGETIVTDLWKIADGEAYYTTKVLERDETVITLGRVTYRT